MFILDRTISLITSTGKKGGIVRGQGKIFLGGFGTVKENTIRMEAPVRLACPSNVEFNKMGAFSYFCQDAYIRGVSEIGRFVSISTNVQMGLPQHPTNLVTTSGVLLNTKMDYWCADFLDLSNHLEHTKILGEYWNETEGKRKKKEIKIGNDVWIGANAVIAPGVTIGDGAIVGNNAVVTKDVEPYTIVAGIPAKTIRRRFSDRICERLLKTEWWKFGVNILYELPPEIEKAIYELENRTTRLSIFEPEEFVFYKKEKSIYREYENTKTLLYDFNQ